MPVSVPPPSRSPEGQECNRTGMQEKSGAGGRRDRAQVLEYVCVTIALPGDSHAFAATLMGPGGTRVGAGPGWFAVEDMLPCVVKGETGGRREEAGGCKPKTDPGGQTSDVGDSEASRTFSSPIPLCGSEGVGTGQREWPVRCSTSWPLSKGKLSLEKSHCPPEGHSVTSHCPSRRARAAVWRRTAMGSLRAERTQTQEKEKRNPTKQAWCVGDTGGPCQVGRRRKQQELRR